MNTVNQYSGVLELFNELLGSTQMEQATRQRLQEYFANVWTDYSSTKISDKALKNQFFESNIPAQPNATEDYFKYLFEQIVENSIRTHSPRFIGHMTTALPSFVHQISKILTALNQNNVKIETSRSLTFYERQAVAMMHRLFYNETEDFYQQHIQHPESNLGVFCSGGTIANISALWLARNKALPPKGDFEGVAEEGMPEALNVYGYRKAVVICSSLGHYSLKKGLDVLGLGKKCLLTIPANDEGQIDAEALEKLILGCQQKNYLIVSLVGIAGTTETGHIDPLETMAKLAQKYNIHFHVDAAWGGPVIFSEIHKNKLKGIELANTITVDGHKQLYLPMGLGLILTKNPRLTKATEHSAKYIIRKNTFDLGRRTIEGSRPAMGMFLHAGLHIIGKEGYEQLINGGIDRAQYLKTQVQESEDFQLIYEPTLNIVSYRYVPERYRQAVVKDTLSLEDNEIINKFNTALQREQKRIGKGFVSRTTVTKSGVPITFLRSVLANPLTQFSDIDYVLATQREIAEKLYHKMQLFE